MFSKISSFCKYFIVAFIFSFSALVNGQSRLYLFGMGSINYIPMKNFSHRISQLSYHQIDEFGFTGNFGIKYCLTENQWLVLGAEIVNKNVSYSGGPAAARWNFKIVPISVGYQYQFSNQQDSFRPYAGLNVSYSVIEISGVDWGEGPNDPFYNEYKIGIEPNTGFSYRIVDRYYLITELKYRAVSDVTFLNKDVNFSGLMWNVGVQINIL